MSQEGNPEGTVFVPDNEDELVEFQTASGPVIMDFSAVWCGPCKRIEPVFKQLARDNPEVKFVKIDVDEFPEFAAEMKIQAMPTFLFREEGETINALTILGASKERLEANLEALLLGNYASNDDNDETAEEGEEAEGENAEGEEAEDDSADVNDGDDSGSGTF